MHPRCGNRLRSNRRSNLAPVVNLAAGAKFIPTRQERDPTQQANRRLQAERAIRKRIKQAHKPVLALFDSIPVREVEVQTNTRDENGQLVANRIFYRYDLRPEMFENIDAEIRRVLGSLLETNSRGKPARWFFDQYIEQSYQGGTTQSAGRIDAMARGAGLDIPEAAVERVLQSPAYRRRLELTFARTFEDMKGFEGKAADDLGRVLFNGVAGGKSPRDIAGSILDTFDDIEGFRAERIARTEINKAFTDARMEQTIDARDRLGIEVRLMHVSALSPGTRPDHADRHGKVFTPEEQEEWWSEGANRINCLCSTVEILYMDGQPVQDDLIQRQRQRGIEFFKEAA